VTARYLGPTAFGEMYIGSTFNSLGFLFIEWGQPGVIPAIVAADSTEASAVLGTSLVWRLVAVLIGYPILIVLCAFLGYSTRIQLIVSLFFIGYTLSALTNTGQWLLLGLEQAKVGAYRQIIEQSAIIAIVVPILLVGGGVVAALIGHALAAAVALVYVANAVRKARIGALSADMGTWRTLAHQGTPFVLITIAMILQPAVDVAFLSRLSSDEVVGWYSAARRLVGVLIFPASALVGALYPTLCRLRVTDFEAFKRLTRNGLRGTSMVVVPVALGCYLYPDIGVAFFDRRQFVPAEANLRVLSIFVFLLYFSMPIGVAILAAGRRRAWTIVQSLCIAVSVAFDPVLIPWFQRRHGNGGLGICVTTVISEVIVLASGVWLAPAGLFDRQFWRAFAPITISGVAMLAVARALVSTSSFAAAPIAVIAYVSCLWITGGLDKRLVAELKDFLPGKLLRRGR
jgi:O-antigen/teichoic acid export membrane protein